MFISLNLLFLLYEADPTPDPPPKSNSIYAAFLDYEQDPITIVSNDHHFKRRYGKVGQ